MKSLRIKLLSAFFTAFCAVLLFTAGCKKDLLPPTGGGPNTPKDSSFVVKVTNTCSHTVPNSGTTGKCDGSATASVSGGLQPYKFLWNNGMTTPSVSGLCPGTYVVTVTDGKGSVIKDSTIVTHCDTINHCPDSLHAKVSVTCNNGTSANNICNGSATVQAGGGKAPYKFHWSNGQNGPVATGLCAGTYKVTITDSTGKSITQVVMIQQCLKQDSLLVKFNKTCSHGKQMNGTVSSCDGTATVIVNGGNVPYKFQWSNGQNGPSATGLCPGTHCVSITDASGLTKKECVMIDACKDSLPPPPTGNITVTIAPNCSHKPSNTTGNACDGSATAKAAGGTAPYVFQWDNGQTGEVAKGLCPGTYCVTVKDAAGLAAKQCVTIATCLDSLPPPTGGLKLTFTATCSHAMPNTGAMCDGSATVNASGGTGPYTYLWSDGQTTSTAKGLCPGTHTVSVTDANGVTMKGTVTIAKCP